MVYASLKGVNKGGLWYVLFLVCECKLKHDGQLENEREPASIATCLNFRFGALVGTVALWLVYGIMCVYSISTSWVLWGMSIEFYWFLYV